ncbi:protein involved in propionate catabolism [Rhizobium sp. Root73]|uniref:MmgE/PrpD family protein n=1 Tax=unclassified Rhizobium TaxID=2613769 RepID=UPI0007254802|nr:MULTISPECIES: MmgE/PrpD family protein [unclassified Rhizobium]KQY15066.1 protein involved in propionate catabolism [Rhizobium sp. Root1334]KRC06498.1 protein involved in propionate catabolism [Rhizobium sp. Root73]
MNTTPKSMQGETKAPFVLSELAAFCHSMALAPESAHAAARRTLLDTIGVAAAGAETVGGLASRRAAVEIWGRGGSAIWFSQSVTTPAGAAFANSTFAAALDLDDGHRAASGHPAAAIVPAVIAAAEQLGSSTDRILTALVLGYEVAVRISSARDFSRLRTTDSGLWCGYGVAAATAWLAGLGAPAMAHAMAIAGQTATSQAGTGWTRLGHSVKEGIPWATANGLQSVSLAASGHYGPLDLLDNPSVYNRERLLGGFGRKWVIEDAYFKIYSCCRWAHAAIDGSLALAADMCMAPDDIDEILVETFDRALTLPNQFDPQSSEAAQYSVPFCLALALVKGPTALLPLKPESLGDASVVSLARRVKMVRARDYLDAFPKSTPSKVTISAGGRRKTIEVLAPKGEPQNPLTSDELQQKFLTLTAELSLNPPQVQALQRAASGLGIEQTSTELFRALRCVP